MKLIFSIVLFMMSTVANAAATPTKFSTDVIQWGKGGSTLNHSLIFSFPAGNVPTLSVDNSTRTLQFNLNQQMFGDATNATNKNFYFNNGTSNKPGIRWDFALNKLRFTNDGTTFFDMQTGAVSSTDPKGTVNIGFASSEAANALTIDLTQADGVTTPNTGSGAVTISVRSDTITNGGYTAIATTSALSIIVPSGATLGQANGVEAYNYIYAQDNSGVIQLCVSGSAGWDEGTIYTSTTISAGADSNAGLYCTAGATGGVRLIGRFRNTQATAGTWVTPLAEISAQPFTKEMPHFRGYLESSTQQWTYTTTGAGPVDAATTSTTAVTTQENIGIGTCVQAASNYPGVQCDGLIPKRKYEVCADIMSYPSSAATALWYIWDGTTTIAKYSFYSTVEVRYLHLCGEYIPTVANPSIRIGSGNNPSITMNIGQNTFNTTQAFSIRQID